MKDRRLWLFVVLAYGFSWGIYALCMRVLGLEGPMGIVLTSAFFMLGPASAALVLKNVRPRWTWRALGVTVRDIPWGRLLLGIGMAVALVPLTLSINVLLGNVLGLPEFGHTAFDTRWVVENLSERLRTSGAPSTPAAHRMAMLDHLAIPGWLMLAGALLLGAVVGATANLPFALGEELGWRGMLLGLTRRWGIAGHVLLTGCIWGLWHAPLVLSGLNYPQHPVAGVVWMCGLTLSMALPLAWARVRSGCIWGPAAMHGTVNATAGAVALFTRGGDERFGSAAGLSGMLAMALVSVLILLLDRGFVRAFREPLPLPTEAPSPGS